MEIRKFLIPAVLIIVFGTLSRLIPHPANFAPIVAMSLFSGVYLPRVFAFIVPLIAVFVSDIFLGFYGAGMIYVYGSYVLIGLIGLWLKKHKNVKNILGVTLFSSILFYLITNFGVWAQPHSFYSKDIAGLMNSYIGGIPFFRNSLLGDFTYVSIFFGGYEFCKLVINKFASKKIQSLLF